MTSTSNQPGDRTVAAKLWLPQLRDLAVAAKAWLPLDGYAAGPGEASAA
jgi:hypothetical protein